MHRATPERPRWIIAALLTLFAATAVLAGGAPQATDETSVAERAARETVEYLASDAMRGRKAGSDEMAVAAGYVAGQFKSLGLEPAGDEGTYFQAFRRGNSYVDEASTHATATLAPDGEPAATLQWTLGRDFEPFRFSGRGAVNAPLVFAGYGVTAPERGYDDYAGIDVKGAAVLLMRYEPGVAGFGRGDTSPSRHATFAAKVLNAQRHGAVAVIIFTAPASGETDRDGLYGMQAAVGDAVVTIPVLQVTQAEAAGLLKASGHTPAEIQNQIDTERHPRSFAIEGARLDAAVAFKTRSVEMRNVVALLPGSDPDVSGEVVVIGAHLDHIGVRRRPPKDPDEDVIFNGADDNASGVAAMLVAARELSQAESRPRRSIIFCAFDGEEAGLLGSRHYVSRPARPIAQTVAMLNFDMVGRLRRDTVMVIGAGTGKGLRGVIEAASARCGLKARFLRMAPAGSDHASFDRAGVPAVFFHTWVHADYHKVTDEAAKIDFAGVARVGELGAAVARSVADAAERPEYRRGGSLGLDGPRPKLGVVVGPDGQGHLKVLTVGKGSGAEAAGIRVGDVIERVDREVTGTLVDVLLIAETHKVGDVVEVDMRRDGEAMTVEVTLGE